MEKTPEQVQKDIQDIMRQITSSVTFLPSLEEKCKSRLPEGRLIPRDKRRFVSQGGIVGEAGKF